MVTFQKRLALMLNIMYLSWYRNGVVNTLN